MAIYRMIVVLMLLVMQSQQLLHAGVGSNNLDVSVSVPATVSLILQPMDFGSTFNANATLQASANIIVNIDQSIPYNITLDAGLNFSGERRMSDGAGSFRSYLLYKDAVRTQLWGDSDFDGTYMNGSSVAGGATANVDQVHTVYGTSPAAAINPGNYSDAVTVTVHY